MASTTALSALSVPQFNPASAPRCRVCNQAAVLRTVLPSNPNGNVGRTYFVCCPCRTPFVSDSGIGNPTSALMPVSYARSEDISAEASRWVAWNDMVGVEPANPRCFCVKPSRFDQVGLASTSKLPPKTGFYNCAQGLCGFFSLADSGQVKKEGQVANRGLTAALKHEEEKDGLAAGGEMKGVVMEQNMCKKEELMGENTTAAEPEDDIEGQEGDGWMLLDEIKEEN